MIWLMLTALACLAIVIGGIVFAVQRQPKPDANAVVIMKEPIINIMMSVMLIALCATLLAIGFSGYRAEGGTEIPMNIAVSISLMCAVVGTYGIWFTLLKQVVVYKDKITVVDLLGRSNTIQWGQITSVKTRPLSKKVTLYVGDEPYAINGGIEPYKKFVAIASRNISTMVAGDSLKSIDAQINAPGKTLKR